MATHELSTNHNTDSYNDQEQYDADDDHGDDVWTEIAMSRRVLRDNGCGYRVSIKAEIPNDFTEDVVCLPNLLMSTNPRR